LQYQREYISSLCIAYNGVLARDLFSVSGQNYFDLKRLLGRDLHVGYSN